MKFNSGDRVGFLNEKLSGKIVRLKQEGIYIVETEDGFELDVPEKELVLVSRAAEVQLPSAREELAGEKEHVKSSRFAALLEKDAVFIVASPAVHLQVLSGPVRYVLVNTTNYNLLYAVSVKTGLNLHLFAKGELDSQDEKELITIPRASLMDWEHILVQAVFFSEKPFDRVPLINREIPVLLPDLQVSLKNAHGETAYSKFLKITSAAKDLPLDLDALKDKFGSGEDKPISRSNASSGFSGGLTNDTDAILYNEKEIDLHIQHLVDDYKNLTNSEMLAIQMKRFRFEMDQALKKNYYRVIFIHGVGSGVLRNEILRELRSYPGVSARDAAFEKYGFGATEVILK